MTDYDRIIIDRALNVRVKVSTAYVSQHDCDGRPRVLLNLTADEIMAVIQGLNLLEELSH